MKQRHRENARLIKCETERETERERERERM